MNKTALRIVLIAFMLIANLAVIYISDESTEAYRKYKSSHNALANETGYQMLSESMKIELLRADTAILRQTGVTGKLAANIFILSLVIIALDLGVFFLRSKKSSN
jgi:hypothetical protein